MAIGAGPAAVDVELDVAHAATNKSAAAGDSFSIAVPVGRVSGQSAWFRRAMSDSSDGLVGNCEMYDSGVIAGGLCLT